MSPFSPSAGPDCAARLFAGSGEMCARCRALDWDATPLGPVAQWPESLWTTAQSVLAHPFPHVLLWGPDLVQLYNDGYRALMGAKHPAGRLIVEDDGRGFDPGAAGARVRRERRLGLAGMRERAALVGGTVAVESGPGAGTTVYVRLPVDHALAPAPGGPPDAAGGAP